jgi:predicted outer membrane protein
MSLLSECVFLVVMFVLFEVGRRLGVRALAKTATAPSTGVLEGALFGLMALLLAFTFSGAANRWEWRRSLVVDEANAIGTAYLRLDLLPPSTQPALRESFRKYVRSRLAVYEKLPDIEGAKEALRHSRALQVVLWRQAVEACQETGSPAVMTLVLSEINKMIDLTTTRTMATQAHLPLAVFAMLAVTVLVGCIIAGYSVAANRSPLHCISFVVLIGLTVYLIVELEYPRLGLLRVDSVDQVRYATLDGMK